MEDANTTFAQDLIASMNEAAVHAPGEETGARGAATGARACHRGAGRPCNP